MRYREHKAKKTGAKCSSSSIGQGATIDVMLKRKACGPVAIVGATDGNNEGVDTKKQKVAIEDPHNTETSLNIEGNWSNPPKKVQCRRSLLKMILFYRLCSAFCRL